MSSTKSDLIVKDSIRVLTQNGESLIEFCLGDICQLKPNNKVDVLLVSAFGENYDPLRGTLMGALWKELKVSVGNLAKDKAEDLREYYSCWMSKPLPEHLPFKKILCFEPLRLRTVHPKEVVGDVFRCLVPILQDGDGTVITPILSSGKVGFPETELLQSMVEAAVNWMKAGLPLKVLKIVQYATFTAKGEVANAAFRNYEGVEKLFGELKERYDMQYLIPKETPIEYDVYLSCSKADDEIAKKLQEELRNAKSDIRIVVGSDQKMVQGECWQDDMYNTMMQSARVITVLSPNYLKSSACIEQYNIALCCNRKVHKDLLAPFYITSCVPGLPSYMQLVQYVECLPNNVPKMCEAAVQLVRSISTAETNLHSDVHLAELTPVKYDIFLSYSHTNSAEANKIVSFLQKRNPELRIFFDIQELKQGKAWQRLLYHSIDGTTVFIALVSEKYLQSAVCNEEYSLALAKFLTKGDPLQLVLVKIEAIGALPEEYQCVTLVDASTNFTERTEALCIDVDDWLKTPSEETILKSAVAEKSVPKTEHLNLDEEFSSLRRASFDQRFPHHKEVMAHSFKPPGEIPAKGSKCDIAFSYHKADEKYAKYMALQLERLAPGLRLELQWGNNKERLATMESALSIVALVSPSYLESPEQVEEFHIAIWRQRTADPASPVLYPIQVHLLAPRPTYFHIVPYVVSLEDRMWLELAKESVTLAPTMFSKHYNSRFKKEEHLALDVALSDLVSTAVKHRLWLELAREVVTLAPTKFSKRYNSRSKEEKPLALDVALSDLLSIVVKHRQVMDSKPTKPHPSLANISSAMNQARRLKGGGEE